MPIEQTPANPNIDEINERLTDGLKTCRSVVANYKALLSPEHAVAQGSEEAANDEGDDLDTASGDVLS